MRTAWIRACTIVRIMLVAVGLRIACWGGWRPAVCIRPHLPVDSQVDLVREIVADIDQRFPHMPGPLKAREALRVLLNVRPDARVKDLNLLIELALQ